MKATTEPEILPYLKAAADLEALHAELQQSPFIGLLTIEELQALIAADSIRFFYEGDLLLGFGAWIRINQHWVEIGPIYLLKAARGRGIGKRTFEIPVEINKAAGKKLYGITVNPIVKPMFESAGFKEVSFLKLPWVLKRHVLGKISIAKIYQQLSKMRRTAGVTHHIYHPEDGEDSA